MPDIENATPTTYGQQDGFDYERFAFSDDFPVPLAYVVAYGMAHFRGPDGHLWFAPDKGFGDTAIDWDHPQNVAEFDQRMTEESFYTDPEYRDVVARLCAQIDAVSATNKRYNRLGESTDLYFDLAATLRLAEHTVACTAHSPSLGEQADNEPCPGGLEWVYDDGTYLTSTGLPSLLVDPHDPTSPHVAVYAEGWGPGSDRTWLAFTHVGTDDGVEHLHLTTTGNADEPPLIDVLRAAATAGCRYLVLSVHNHTIRIRVSHFGPDGGRSAAEGRAS
jgi:hypothetical protein